MIYKLFILYFTVCYNYINSEPIDTSTLISLQIIHRHGDRTPIAFYRNDPYKSDQWVDGLGELTPRGKQRMFTFGQQLRQRYGNYLGDSPKNAYIRSSASDRCIESASALIAGLYPPKGRWVWSLIDELAKIWQPIAIQTVDKSKDGLLVPNCDCPAADKAYEEIMKSKDVTEFMEKNKNFIQKINDKTGENYTTLRQMDYLYDSINHEINFDVPKPVPKWIKELGNDTLDRLKEFESMAFKYDWSSKKVQRLRGGLMFKELTTNMDTAIKTPDTSKKVYVYSTHDTILVTLLQALNLYSGDPPSYGSALVFELHRVDGQHWVHLFYANVTPVLIFRELDIKLCHLNETQSQCRAEDFGKSLTEFIPNDWETECEIPHNGLSTLNGQSHTVPLLLTYT
ncbi:prostatic acid phosphatase-like, partial [Oppia nitens]|uniref:prostatic acid phosphatase-like n=1 Tax=Oppia nitens TaxID=1686743 RepID=UPI0023D9EAAE